MNLNAIRADYCKQKLSISECASKPLEQLEQWLQQALAAKVLEPTAMSLATILEGRLTNRIVLLKEVNASGLIFFTNYESQKGQALSANPCVAATLFWAELERQVRIEGIAERLSPLESDRYFQSRPYASQIGAWASEQSQPLASKSELLAKVAKLMLKYPINVPRPPHWGGYLIKPERVEFWQGRPSRLHDRICYSKQDEEWHKVRLSP